MKKNISVALIDDHGPLRQGFAELIQSFDYSVVFEAGNGKECIEKLSVNGLPDIIIMDLNMPEMDGYETTLWLRLHYPSIKVLAFSMYNDENAILRMLRNGAIGYLLKDSEPSEFKLAIDTIVSEGFYYPEMLSGRLYRKLHNVGGQVEGDSVFVNNEISTVEIQLLSLASTEMTYSEIAREMGMSMTTVYQYRDLLFEKLGVKSRIGLVLFSLITGLILKDNHVYKL